MAETKAIKSICLTITSITTGGAEKQCLLLASLLQKRYHVQLIIIESHPQDKKHLRFITDQGINHTFLQGSIIRKTLQLRKILRTSQTDLIFSYLPKDIGIAAVAARGLGIVHVGGIRNANMDKKKRMALRLLHNYLLHSSISNCHSGKLFFGAAGFAMDRIQVIPNGIKIDPPKKARSMDGTIKITSIGRFVDQKDFPTALKSIALLLSKRRKSDPRIIFNLVGHGSNQSTLEREIKVLELTDHVNVVNASKDIPAILKHSDIYLSSSLFEGLSNAIMEAMLHSLPIVATDVGDNEKLVLEGENGYVVPVRDHAAMARALEKLTSSSETRINMGNKSYQILSQDYNLSRFETRYLDFINGIK